MGTVFMPPNGPDALGGAPSQPMSSPAPDLDPVPEADPALVATRPLVTALEKLQLAAGDCPFRGEASAAGAAAARVFKSDSLESLGSLASFASAFTDDFSAPVTPSAGLAAGGPREDSAGNPEADLALTPGEIARAQAMWGWLSQENWPSEVTNALTQVGVALFTNLFRISPRLLDLFPFKNEDGTPEQEALEAHALVVMRTLGAAIAGLGDTFALLAYLKGLTAQHIKYGVKVEHYQILAAALMATLEGAFGKNWGAEEEAVWLRIFGLIMHAAKDSYAKAAEADGDLQEPAAPAPIDSVRVDSNGTPVATPKYETAEEAD